ncbi:MAG: hypothetical protein IH968_19535 [Gemmatimonadetes bacterium]|nr:hypothetical protein [Gemmatimonadota bacterium]
MSTAERTGPSSPVTAVPCPVPLQDRGWLDQHQCLAPPIQVSAESGASKWNPIDHRLFSEISKNWAGQPLRSYETILNHIRTTTTKTGLRVSAHLIDREYPKGVKISDAQFATIALERHETQPLRNYTIHPRC